jgi:dethiobiotin synthetase
VADAHEPPGLFLTGTDTGVGKTYVARLLILALRAQGHRVYARKPVESGCRQPQGPSLPVDGLALREAAGGAEALQTVCPYRLAHALAPNRAARLEGIDLRLRDLVLACDAPGDGIVVVEGSGGFLSPLTDDGLNADLAAVLEIPILLVAADRLGCINHVLLTAEAIASRGLKLASVLLNPLPEQSLPEGIDNLVDLQSLLGEKVIALAREPSAARDQLGLLALTWLNR